MQFKRLIKNRIFQKQLISNLIIFFLLILIVGYSIFSIAYKIIYEQSTNYYETMLGEIRDNIDSRFADVDNLNLRLFTSPWFQKISGMKVNIDKERMDNYELLRVYEELANYKSLNSFIDELFIFYRNSNTIISPHGMDDPDIFFNSAFRVENADQNNIYSYIKNSSNTVIIMPNIKMAWYDNHYEAIAYMRSPGLNYDATIVTIVKKEKLDGIIHNFDKSSFILDDKNKLIAGVSDDINKNLLNYSIYKNVNGSFLRKINKKDYMVIYSSSGINQWKYVSLMPINSIMSKALYFKNIFVILLIFCLIFGSFLYFLLTRKSLDSVRKIVSTASKINGIENEKEAFDLNIVENTFDRLLTERNSLENEVERYKPLLRNSLLQKLLKENHDDDKIYKMLLTYNIKYEYKHFRTAVIEIECIENEITGNKMAEIMLVVNEALSSILDKLGIIGQAFEYEGNKIILIVNTNDMIFIKEKTGLYYILGNLKMSIENNYNTFVNIAIGDIHEDKDAIRCSFTDAVKALNYKLLMGNREIILYSDIKARNEFSYYYPIDMESKLIQSIQDGDYNRVSYFLDEIIDENFNKRTLDFYVAKCLFYDLEATALKTVDQIHLAKFNSQVITHELTNFNTFDGMMDYIRKLYRDVCKIMEDKKSSISQEIIINIIKDIDEEYTQYNLSLESIARKYDISISTLSKFFKEQTGFYYSDYICIKRMKRAKELLEKSDLMIKDIAEAVGFINDITFRRVFKKYELVTPGAYREEYQKRRAI